MKKYQKLLKKKKTNVCQNKDSKHSFSHMDRKPSYKNQFMLNSNSKMYHKNPKLFLEIIKDKVVLTCTTLKNVPSSLIRP